jgi:hypothetical protein
MYIYIERERERGEGGMLVHQSRMKISEFGR